MSWRGWKCVCGALAVMLSGIRTMEAATLSVPVGGDLQAALNTARPGDTILLAEGVEFVGNFVLPIKSGTGWITVRTAAPDPVLPPKGQRIHPSHAPLLARLRSPNSVSALRTAPGAHHWVLAYLELAPNYQGYGDILQIGDGSQAQNTLDKVPHHFVLDHLYVHGDPAVGQKRGIALNAAYVDITDSYIADCKGVGQDTQAIGGWNGPGPYLIENNYLEAAGENFLLGGSDPAIANLVADGVTFRRNYVSRPMAWRNPIISTPQRVTTTAQGGGSLPAGMYSYRVVARRQVGQGVWGRSTASTEATTSIAVSTGGAVRVQWEPVPGATEYRVYGRTAGAQNLYWRVTSNELLDTGAAGTAENVPTGTGTRWAVKNLFELKSARNVVVEGNVLENHWQESQPGYSIVLTPRNSGGACTWCVVENVRFEYNIVRNVSAGVNLLGRDSPELTRQTTDIAFRHNLFTKVTTTLGGTGFFMLIGDAPRDVTIEHNTIDANGSSVVYAYGGTELAPAAVDRFRMVANAAKHGSYGMAGASFTYGEGSLSQYFPGALFTANYLAGGPSSRYPAGNLFDGVFGDQFISPSSGDYTVRIGSRLKGAAPDGTDVGADFAALMSRTAGVEAGLAPGGVAPVPAIAEFTVACTYLECTFRDASVPGSAAITGRTWSFGDATSGTGPTATHVYAAAGNYQVTLTVIDGSGLSATVSDLVTVTARVVPSDLVVGGVTAPSTGRPGTTIQVTDTTRNLGAGAAQPSRTTVYLSSDSRLDAADTLLGSRSVPGLSTGAASTSNTVLSLPAGLQAGAYFLVVLADADGVLAESNETNNVAAVALAIEADPVARPDLIVSTLTAPSGAAAGGSIVVSDTTVNQSAGPAPASTTRFWLSRTMVTDAASTPLQGRSVAPLASKAVSTGSTSITIPAGTYPGTYYLIAQADADAAIPELSELNNGRWVLLRVGPDLTVSALSAPMRAVPGGTLVVTETTKNIGAGAAAASSTAFYLSANTGLDPSDVRLQPSRAVPALAANASSTATTTLTLPTVIAGTWYLIAVADDAAAVPELHEVNNARSAAMLMGPDLTISSLLLPATGVAGASIAATSTVQNSGTADAPPSVVRFYLSTDLTLDPADLPLTATRAVPALAPSASHTATTTLLLPSGKTGPYYLLLVGDADQAVAESVELNNVVMRFLQIGAQ